VVLDVAKRLKSKLNAQGIDVILTRKSDDFISLYQRSRIANINARKIDAFISIHANAARSKRISGVEVFYLSESIDDDQRAYTAARNYRLNLREPVSGRYTSAILWDLVYSQNRRTSIQLADYVGKSLSRNLYQRNRGTKPARFYVLKGTNIPAILVELGFISNPQEEKRLRDHSYREKVAQSVAEGIRQYNR
jgi:N-acetylmuramoyl-L-alanine amidase